jgi:hypothetical protein
MELITVRASPRKMSTSPSIIDTRRGQMFPVLEPFEIERVRRLGMTPGRHWQKQARSVPG